MTSFCMAGVDHNVTPLPPRYLENEMVTYISLTQSKSHLVAGVARRMLQILKEDINHRLTGLASSVLRQKMVGMILLLLLLLSLLLLGWSDTKREVPQC